MIKLVVKIGERREYYRSVALISLLWKILILMRGFQRSTFLFELDSLVDWLFDELHAQDQTASRREDRGKKRILIYERSVHNFCGSFLQFDETFVSIQSIREREK